MVESDMGLDSSGTTLGSLSRRQLWLLNQRIRQLVGIAAGTGRTDLREEGPTLRNRRTDGVGRLPGSNTVKDAVDQSVPCTGGDVIVDASVRQYVHAPLQDRNEDQDAREAFRLVQSVLVERLLGAQSHFMRHALA